MSGYAASYARPTISRYLPDVSEFHELARSPRAHADSSRESSIFDSGVLVRFGHVHFRTTRPVRASKGIRRRTLRLKTSGFSIAAFNRRVNWGSADVQSACGSHAIEKLEGRSITASPEEVFQVDGYVVHPASIEPNKRPPYSRNRERCHCLAR